jgi:hypothetical protein
MTRKLERLIVRERITAWLEFAGATAPGNPRLGEGAQGIIREWEAEGKETAATAGAEPRGRFIGY